MRLLIVILLLTYLLSGCSRKNSQEKVSVSQKLNQPKEIFEAQKRVDKPDSLSEIRFDQTVTYGSTEDIIIGEISATVIDEKNRVYIADDDQTSIHVFSPDGKYITSLGRKGKGPGEFSALGFHKIRLKIFSDKLYATDTAGFFPHRINIYSLEELTFSHSIQLAARNKKNYEYDLKGYFPAKIYPRHDGSFWVAYRRMPNEYGDSKSFIRYVIQDSTGRIESAPIFQQADEINLTYDVTNTQFPYTAVHSFPFFESSLFAMSNSDHFYTANTNRFKIDVYNSDGNYIRSFYHAIENKPFSKKEVMDKYKRTGYMSQLGEGVVLKMIQEADNLPNAWPVLNEMFFDDENRLWISTIVKDEDVYQWWVLKKTGEIITKFEWPRDKPIENVKNSYIYTLETEESTGLQTIVKYRVEMD